jgi:hypothetical protein
MNQFKIDLAILNALVKELNDELALANKSKELNVSNTSEYIVFISKCMGLASSLTMEASALSHDFMKEIKVSSSSPLPDPYPMGEEGSDILGNLFSKKKN